MTKVLRQRKTTLAAQAAHTAAVAEAAGSVQAAEVQPADVQTAEAPAPRPAAKAQGRQEAAGCRPCAGPRSRRRQAGQGQARQVQG